MEVNQIAGFDTSQYNALVDAAQTQGVTKTQVNNALLEAAKPGKAFSEAVDIVKNQLPELAAPSSNIMPDPKQWVALPSPCALVVSLIITDAAEQRQANRELIFSQGMSMADLIDKQAEKIKLGATQKFACAITGAAVSMAGSAISLGFASAGVGRTDAGKLAFGSDAAATSKGINDQFTSSFSQSISGLGSSAGQMFTAGGEFAQGLRSAEEKHLEAQQERIRTSMEQTKQTNDAMRDLISKGLDFLSSMQANMNQTRTKILG